MRLPRVAQRRGALLALALLFPSTLLGQAERGGILGQTGGAGILDRISLRGHVGWSSDQSSAFSEVQACPSREAREVGLGVFYRLGRGIQLAVGGSRLSVFDQDRCIFLADLPPHQGSYTSVGTQPVRSAQGYPFGSLWARASLGHRLSRHLSGSVFGGMGYLLGKEIPSGLAGVSADLGTPRAGMFLEYELSWYRVRFVTTTRQYLDGLVVSATDSRWTDGQRSSVVRLGLRYSLGRGGETR